MDRKVVSKDVDSTDRVLSELGHVIDEAELVKYMVRISDEIHRLKLDNAPSNDIKFLSGQLSLLEDRLARLRSNREHKSDL